VTREGYDRNCESLVFPQQAHLVPGSIRKLSAEEAGEWIIAKSCLPLDERAVIAASTVAISSPSYR